MTSDAPITGEPRGFCAQCGKTLTNDTLRDIRGVYYCEDCLAARVAGAPAPRQEGGGGPALAALLGFVPGLGAVYNGEYFKAFVHVMVFGSIIALLARTGEDGAPLFVPLLIAFILYMPFEAYRTARAKAAGKSEPALFGDVSSGPVPAGPLLLIVIGVLLLLERFFEFSMSRIVNILWPLLLIGLGAYMLRKRAQG